MQEFTAAGGPLTMELIGAYAEDDDQSSSQDSRTVGNKLLDGQGNAEVGTMMMMMMMMRMVGASFHT